MGQLKDKKNNVLGMKVRAQIVKNRLGPPLRNADYTMYFDRGIDNYGAWLTVFKDHKLIKVGGAWFTPLARFVYEFPSVGSFDRQCRVFWDGLDGVSKLARIRCGGEQRAPHFS